MENITLVPSIPPIAPVKRSKLLVFTKILLIFLGLGILLSALFVSSEFFLYFMNYSGGSVHPLINIYAAYLIPLLILVVGLVFGTFVIIWAIKIGLLRKSTFWKLLASVIFSPLFTFLAMGFMLQYYTNSFTNTDYTGGVNFVTNNFILNILLLLTLLILLSVQFKKFKN